MESVGTQHLEVEEEVNNILTGSDQHILIFTLNINRLSAPLKSHRMASWIKKHDTAVYCLYEAHLTFSDTMDS